MRRRAQTSSSNLKKSSQEPKFLRQQFQSNFMQKNTGTRLQLSLLIQKYEQLQKQRDVLKQGNTHLIEQFLFNKQRQEFSKLQRQGKQKSQQITELTKIIEESTDMIKNSLEAGKQENRNQVNKYQSLKRFCIKIESDKNIVADKQTSIGYQLKYNLKILIESYRQLAKGGKMYKSFINPISKRSKSRQKLNIYQSQIVIPSSETYHHEQSQQKAQQLNAKVNDLISQNQDLKQKIQQLTLDLMNSNLQKKNSPEEQVLFQGSKSTNPILKLNDYTVPMATSLCNTQQLKNSIIYDKLSQSSIMQQSIVTESYDKRMNKLQKINSMLEKDYQVAKQKIKTLNREYSKLKLDYLKIQQDKRRIEESHQRKTSSLNEKMQTLNKKIKDLQVLNEKTKSEKNREKQSNKNIISQHQSKILQLQQKLQKNAIQISHLKEQIQISKKQNQQTLTHAKQLQIQKLKSKQLEKQLQQRTLNFEKSLKNYETIILEMRKVNSPTNEKLESNKRQQSENKSRSKSKQSSVKNSFFTPSQSSLLTALRQEIKLLQQTIAMQNERYNILQNSNKELRQRLIKMVQSEQKLRKELINQRIKTRTNKSISQSSKYSNKARSVLRKGMNTNENDKNFQNSQYDAGDYQLGSEIRLQDLKIKSGRKENASSYLVATERSPQDDLNSRYSRTLKQSSSSRELKSQSMILAQANLGIENLTNSKINHKNTTSQLKSLRERRFDPKQTQVSKKRQPIFNDKYTNDRDNHLLKVSQKQQRPVSPVDGFKSLINNQSNFEPKINKIQYKNQNQQHSNEFNREKQSFLKNQPAPQKQQSPISSSPKYVYQPPKPKKISPKPSQLSNSSFIPTSQPASENKQISLQISQSQSNLSRGDKIIELFTINNDTKNQNSPFVNPFAENETSQKPSYVKQQPVSFGKFADLNINKKEGSNIVMNGRTQKQTKSSADVRFTRKF